MDSRRDFIKKATLLAAGSGLGPIEKALSINPHVGSTVWDAEHIVILMQENRSFDHIYGSLQGVRGFNDPRAISQPDGSSVFFQKDAQGNVFTPFRLDLKESNATWLNSLPHAWEDQSRARNGGWHNAWLDQKRTWNEKYQHVPLTMGYYNRQDLPFYYALADAFTVCDQHFCSSLTGTTPNRLYLWSGTIREQPDFESKANVCNEDIEFGPWAKWRSFPELLEQNHISWRIYQNELYMSSGLEGEFDQILGNFGDNPIEYFEKFQVKFHPEHRAFLKVLEERLPKEIKAIEALLNNGQEQDFEALKKDLLWKNKQLEEVKRDILIYTEENYQKLSDFTKSIHQKAFTNNRNSPDYHALKEVTYTIKGEKKIAKVPKGDILYQFRKDVQSGTLPTVSWLVAPEQFCDHPDAPFYGAWYVSEVMDILTQNPEVWKKTVFMLTYDENDGQFDHQPPFVAPDTRQPKTGKVSAQINTEIEQVNIKHEKQRPYKNPEKEAVDGPIGLGYRVPLVIASPWSRGGRVCSQVFDHTSPLQFLEKFLTKKFKKEIKETNISDWRRTVCGDLTSVFKPYSGEAIALPKFIDKEPFYQSIYEAQFKDVPNKFVNFKDKELKWHGPQEPGTRKACALPYHAVVNAQKTTEGLLVSFKNLSKVGMPFIAFDFGQQKATRNYAVKSGDTLTDLFDDHVKIHGPNGYYRDFKVKNGAVKVSLSFENQKGVLDIQNTGYEHVTVVVKDLSYGKAPLQFGLEGQSAKIINSDFVLSHHWYHLGVWADGDFYEFAGHLETGKESYTDPAMGQIIA